MVSKAQKKKQQARKRLQKTLQKRRVETLADGHGSAAQDQSNRERLARQKPKAWEGELPADVALFDDQVLQELSEDVAAEARAVRQALAQARDGRPDEALEAVGSIPRSSPYSEWRIFVRGLVAWLDDQHQAAAEVWNRLDFNRRAGRIAVAMMTSTRKDLAEITAPAAGTASPENARLSGNGDPWLARLDAALLYHAKLLHRARFDRAAIRVAKAGLCRPEQRVEGQTVSLSPQTIEWLRDYTLQFRASEPQLVARLEQTALKRALEQNFVDIFEMAKRAFQGPRHDPHNRLLSFFYYNLFNSDQEQEQAFTELDTYLEKDLPRNEQISNQLRKAMLCEIYLRKAGLLIAVSTPRGPFLWGYGLPKEDTQGIRKCFREAQKAYPAHRGAYTLHCAWLQLKLENDELTKERRNKFLQEKVAVMKAWAKALPDDIEPRLFLVDHLLENEQMDEAQPHVEWLAASRHDDPRVRATPWKWQLLDAMRLCRRKAWLSEVPARLDEAEVLWPKWLSREWLPYLRAAYALRNGDRGAHERIRHEIVEQTGVPRDSLGDAARMLAAAQQMRLPAAELKPFRVPIDAKVKVLTKLTTDELIDAGSFFWDLHRTRLLYPAYRMHGSKFARQLWKRVSTSPDLVRARLEDTRFQGAVLWCSEHRLDANQYDVKLPPWMREAPFGSHPVLAAAWIHAFFAQTYPYGVDNLKDAAQVLRQAASTHRDPYYRYWYGVLVEQVDKATNEQQQRIRRFSPIYEPDDDEELDFDPDCNCPKCQAARARQEARR